MPESHTGQKPVVCHLSDELLKYEPSDSDRLVFSKYFKPLVLKGLPADADPDDPAVHKALLSSELGYLFLDRTRIRPKGFAVGEHVHSFSLAPGEEVTVEQRTFSKRETTLEEQNESERQLDLEMSSTLSTELSEGLERATSRNDQTTFSLSLGASAGSSDDGGGGASPVRAGGSTDAKVSADVSYARNITEANTQTQRRSVKDSASASSKVASKYRAQHKMLFRVTTEQRFEQGSKRVLKNPNPYAPIDLHYFKILRRIEVTQERIGVRLCWQIAVENPAGDFVTKVETGRRGIVEKMLAAVRAALPLRPAEPTREDEPPVVAKSAVREADKYGLTGDMRANYDLRIPIPAGYIWNGVAEDVTENSKAWGRPPNAMGWYVEGTPWVDGTDLVVTIHIGAGSWIGGPKIWVQAGAQFMADPRSADEAYKQEYTKWLALLAQWEEDVRQALAEPTRRAEAAADLWTQSMFASLDPVNELMERAAKHYFPEDMRNEAWEVDFWGQVFDWQRGGMSVFPSWWSKEPPREHLRGPYDFLNASWARLYIPIRPGFERLAARFILAHRDGAEGPVDPETEAAITSRIEELRAYRQASFGDPLETPIDAKGGLTDKYLLLAKWPEVLPTDGTHVEVVQAMTTAADSATQMQLDDTRAMRQARTQGELQDVEMKKRALAQISSKANVEIRVATDKERQG